MPTELAITFKRNEKLCSDELNKLNQCICSINEKLGNEDISFEIRDNLNNLAFAGKVLIPYEDKKAEESYAIFEKWCIELSVLKIILCNGIWNAYMNGVDLNWCGDNIELP